MPILATKKQPFYIIFLLPFTIYGQYGCTKPIPTKTTSRLIDYHQWVGKMWLSK